MDNDKEDNKDNKDNKNKDGDKEDTNNKIRIKISILKYKDNKN